MVYAVLGDIHSNLEALKAVLKTAEKAGADRFLCTGDIVGYNANPHECLKLMRELEPDIIVKGNHDEYVGSKVALTGFNKEAATAVEWTRSQLTEEEQDFLYELPYKSRLSMKVELAHATLDSPGGWEYVFDRFSANASMTYQSSQICFVGHTHVPVAFDKSLDIKQIDEEEEGITTQAGHKYLINVGSVGQPRDGDPRAAFVTYDTDEGVVRRHRVEYDMESAQQRVLDVGLPERLAARLGIGC